MIFDGINLIDTSVFTNLNVQHDTTLPASGVIGKIFYLESPDVEIAGLYVFDNTWKKVSSKQVEFITGNGLSYDETTKVISSKIPETGLENQFLTFTDVGPDWTNISKTTVGLNNVDNTSDLNKPLSNAVIAALDNKVSAASPAFTGTPTVNGFKVFDESTSGIFNISATITHTADVGTTNLSLNLLLSNHFVRNINTSAGSTVYFTNVPANSMSFILELVVGESVGTVTWPTNVYWSNDMAPPISANKSHIIMFIYTPTSNSFKGSSLTGFTA